MKIKTTRLLILLLLLSVFGAVAVYAMQDIADHPSCGHCGMNRKAYGFSRMVIQYEDGTQAGVCSLHCAVTEMESQKGRKIRLIQVADRKSHELIDAAKAFWVIGGSRRGVMTGIPKWAFSTKNGAEEFINEYGGAEISWNEALEAARKEPL